MTVISRYFRERFATVLPTALVDKAPTSVANPTGTATRTTFATGSVEVDALAERVYALILDLKTAGVIK